jgi:hypothetical protein
MSPEITKVSNFDTSMINLQAWNFFTLKTYDTDMNVELC